MFDQILNLFAPHICHRCGQPGALLCPKCKKHNIERASQPHQANGFCFGRRRGSLKALVDGSKFRSQRAALPIMAEFLDLAVPDLPADTVVVPIPTVPAHIRQRGFDHAALLAKHFARRRRLKYAHLLWRKTTLTQHHLASAAERKQAAAQAFYLTKRKLPAQILLVDDIKTSGATLAAARALLLRRGAQSVKTAVVCEQVAPSCKKFGRGI